eukprot:COSAG01_NODE_1224_length_11142_cov_72.842615_7_plen_140_part_00
MLTRHAAASQDAATRTGLAGATSKPERLSTLDYEPETGRAGHKRKPVFPYPSYIHDASGVVHQGTHLPSDYSVELEQYHAMSSAAGDESTPGADDHSGSPAVSPVDERLDVIGAVMFRQTDHRSPPLCLSPVSDARHRA